MTKENKYIGRDMKPCASKYKPISNWKRLLACSYSPVCICDPAPTMRNILVNNINKSRWFTEALFTFKLNPWQLGSLDLCKSDLNCTKVLYRKTGAHVMSYQQECQFSDRTAKALYLDHKTFINIYFYRSLILKNLLIKPKNWQKCLE